jgi:hypothetical protein
MREMVKDWLRTKHTTLWVDWDITDRKEIEQAAAWFEKELQSFQAYEYERWVLRSADVPAPTDDGTLPPLQHLDFPPPSPYTHESQLAAAGQLVDWGPDLDFGNEGVLAGGLHEYQMARDWVHEQIGEIFA